MDQNQAMGQLKDPRPPQQRGPSPSRSFSDLYQRVYAVNKKFYRGKVPSEVVPLIQTYAETKYGMMYGGTVHMNEQEMVLRVGEDPIQKAQGIVANGPGQSGPIPQIK